MEQELVFQASYLQKQMSMLQEQLSFLDGEILELGLFNKNLTEIAHASEKEIFASIGKGVHLKSLMKEKEFLVEVGSQVLVKKSPEETSKIINNQIKKLADAKSSLSGKLEEYHNALHDILSKIKSVPENLKHNHYR